MDNILKNNSLYLEYLIDNELLASCPLLTAKQFINYCKERDIDLKKEQLEQFEKIKLFYPIARVYYRDIRGTYFRFKKEYAINWLKDGHLWHPASRDFQDWKTFYDEDGEKNIESFYSIFQCYSLYILIHSTKVELRAEWIDYYNEKNFNKTKKFLESSIENFKKRIELRIAPLICQIISNRYNPETQTNRRTIRVPGHSFNSNSHMDWVECCRKWDVKKIFKDMNIPIKEIKKIHGILSFDAKNSDPLANWYDLIRFVSVNKKNKLKDKALIAQTIYSMEHMLRLFYKAITGDDLYPPDESMGPRKAKIYGNDVIKNELEYLKYLVNQYDLNPKPKLILIVEGQGELEQFPKLSEKLFRCSFPKLGIEIYSINGIDNFTGKEAIDKYGALEKFIDYHHYNQTFVYIISDDEKNASVVKKNLIKAKSIFLTSRFLTKREYINLWCKKTIEFSNFTHDEIAKAMTKCCRGRYVFQVSEIEDCENELNAKESDVLSALYKEKSGIKLKKKKLLEILCGFIIVNPEKDVGQDRKEIRPIVKHLEKIIELAAKNHQPSMRESWEKNQDSGFFGQKCEGQ